MRIRKPVDRPRLVLRAVGWVGVLFSMFGLYGHKLYLSWCPPSQQPPGIRPVYYTMIALDLVITLATFFLAAGLTQGWAKAVPFFVGVQFLVLAKFVIPGLLPLTAPLDHTIFSVTTFTSNGTDLMVITLYPFWGSVAAIWAANRMRAGHPDVSP
jgi:hypothetical protein